MRNCGAFDSMWGVGGVGTQRRALPFHPLAEMADSLFGRRWSEAELKAHVSDMSQLASVRRSSTAEGECPRSPPPPPHTERSHADNPGCCAREGPRHRTHRAVAGRRPLAHPAARPLPRRLGRILPRGAARVPHPAEGRRTRVRRRGLADRLRAQLPGGSGLHLRPHRHRQRRGRAGRARRGGGRPGPDTRPHQHHPRRAALRHRRLGGRTLRAARLRRRARGVGVWHQPPAHAPHHGRAWRIVVPHR